MSNVINLSQRLAHLSRLLVTEQANDNTDEIEKIEEEIMNIQDELDDLTDFEQHHNFQ